MMRQRLSDRQVLWGLMTLYLVIFGTLTALRHYSFETQTWDMGIFAQSFWNASNGRGLINTIEQVPNHLGVHFSPILFLLVPGYALFQSLFAEGGQYYLLIIQTLALALGAWPLFLLAKKIFIEQGIVAPFWPRMIVIAYLLYPPLHAVNLFDFHEAAFVVPLLLGALCFLQEKRWLWAGVFLLLSAGTKEDAPLAILFVGLFLLFTRIHPSSPVAMPPATGKKSIVAGTIVVSAFVYFLLVVTVLMPSAGGGVFRIDRYAHLGQTGIEIVRHSITDPLLLIQTAVTPAKAYYVFWLLLPLLFLPLLSWRALILIVPGLAENVLTNYPPQFSSLYHYDALLIPGIFLATIYGASIFIARWPTKEKYLRWLFLSAVFVAFLIRSPLRPTAFPIDYFRSTPQKEAYRGLVRLVPPKVSVSANTNLVPHLANREKIYFAGFEPEPTDIVLLDAENSFGFGNEDALMSYVERYRLSGNYNSYLFDDRYMVLLDKKLKISGLPGEPQK